MGMSNYLKNLCFNKNKTEIIVEDDNKELPDVRKISVPDLKQYLIKGYEEIRKVKQEKEQLENDLEDAKKYKDLYEASLVTANEFQKRDEENNVKITKLNDIINNLRLEIEDKDETINNYKIQKNELEDREQRIDTIIHDKEQIAIAACKESLIEEITNLKGSISKTKLISLIEKVSD